MENLEILIIEDDILYIKELKKIIKGWGCKTIRVASSSTNALNILKLTTTDIIIINVNIQENFGGIQIVKQVKHLEIPVIYITNQKSEDYYEEAKKTNFKSYLVKPFNKLILKSAIETSVNLEVTEKETEENTRYFYVRKGKNIKKILFKDIYLVVSDRNYCDIYHGESKSTVKSSLKKVINQLPERLFLRVHNQHIVRLDNIKEVLLSKGEIIMNNNNMSIPIGRSFKKQLKERLNVL